MVVPSRCTRLLFLLLFLAALPATSVRCQHASVTKVSSDDVEVTWYKIEPKGDTRNILSLLNEPVVVVVIADHVYALWERTEAWADVEDFTVFLNTTGILCTKVKQCRADTCIFYGEECGSLLTCSHSELTVSGNGTSYTVPFQAAPEPVTDLDVKVVEDELHIKWTNPSIESSTCYNHTQVQVKEGLSVFSTTYHPIMEENVTVPLGCTFSDGTVVVTTSGGNGHSKETNRRYWYSGNALVMPKHCQAVGCYGVELAWDYNPVCPEVTQFCVETEDNTETKVNCTEDTATTSLQVTGLEESNDYTFKISAYGKDGRIGDPADQICSTHDTAVRNLVVASTSPTSLNATWDPPLCLSTQGLEYEVYVANHDDLPSTTTETNFMWTDLEDFTKYYVHVVTEGNDLGESFAYTQPRRVAWVRLEMAGSDSVLVEWEDIEDYVFPRYEVTWDSMVHYTSFHRYTIPGYSSVEALGKVCVAVSMEIYGMRNLTGPTRCGDDSGNPNVLLIVLLSVGIPTVIASVVGIALARRKRQKKTEKPSPTDYIDQTHM